jgi:hypothetical protein
VKREPEATFVTALDGASVAKLYQLVALADGGNADARSELSRLLRDILRRTNDVNLDRTGLHNLTQLVNGVLTARHAGDRADASPVSRGLLDALDAAAEHIRIAIADRGQRDHSLQQARSYLAAAADAMTN